MSEKTDLIRDIIERSHFTVKHGHIWTQDDHARLVETLQACADDAIALLTTMGIRGYLVTLREENVAGFKLIALETDVEAAKKSLDASWMDCTADAGTGDGALEASGLVAIGDVSKDPTMVRNAGAIWLLQFGGDPRLDEYIGYG